ncbi:MAG: lipoyl synthase [Acidimicrobiales bacterium]
MRLRWLGRVPYEEAHELQRALRDADQPRDGYVLMLEHPHVVTVGLRGDMSHVLADPATIGSLGGKVVRTDRGGDVTYHGPGQMVVYPIVDVPKGPRSIPCFVHQVEQIVIDAIGQLGRDAGLAGFAGRVGRLADYPGVWVDPHGPDPKKICAIGIRVSRGRSMHGIALNVSPDMEWFSRIVPCGITDKGVTSLALEGVNCSMAEVADAIATQAVSAWAPDGEYDRQDVAGLHPVPSPLIMAPAFVSPDVAARAVAAPDVVSPAPGASAKIRLRQAGVDPDAGVPMRERKPQWLRAPVVMGDRFRNLGRTMRDLGLVTVCEEAGCPNIYECWADGTATFMINGERCTRACGFCLVDTRHPMPIDPEEPVKVAEAVEKMGLAYAVVTAVARDDMPDGGAEAFAATIRAIRERCPGTSVEVLIPDCKGNGEALDLIFAERPEVLNHNLETVARLQRAVRPSAGYARSLAVLARAAKAGLVVKSGIILGMGETTGEVRAALVDLRAVGVSIVTIGQYLRPSAKHIPVARWVTPEEFEELGEFGRNLGFDHVESSPLTRSSYHAKAAMESANGVGGQSAVPVEFVVRRGA